MRWVFMLLLLANGIYWAWMEFGGGMELMVSDTPQALSPDVPSLVLLSELDADGKPAAADKGDGVPAEPESQPQPATAAEYCWQLGPIADEELAMLIEKSAARRGWRVDADSIELSSVTGYWVYTGPYATRSLAQEQLNAYHSKKIDSFLIGDGELSNAISLGLFSTRERAETARQERRGQGYPAKVHEVRRTEPATLLQVRGLDATAPTVTDFLAKTPVDGKNTPVEKKSCN